MGKTLFDRPKPTVGCNANGRRSGGGGGGGGGYGIKLMSQKHVKINCRSARVVTNDRTSNLLQQSSATCHVICLRIEKIHCSTIYFGMKNQRST